MTWGRNNDTYEGMQQQLTENYLEMADVLDAYCAPVGEAWRRVRRECPSLQLYNSDGSHPSPAGSYLAACVFYAIFLVSLLAAIIMQVYRLKRLFIYRG